jgi:hypothetical protein
MATFGNFISALVGLILLTQCKSKEYGDGRTRVTPTAIVTKHKNRLIGEWRYNLTFYSSELTLQDDGTFTFHDEGCLGQKFSHGQWINTDDLIFLTSFDDFKQKEQIKDIEPFKVIAQLKPKHKLKKGPVEYSFVGFKEISAPAFPGPHDTVRVYLDRVQLQLRNDTLYCVGSNKLPEEAKFYRTKNNR